jgi:hypothetical protein
MFENRMLRRIFAHKREKVTKSWTQLHNEELYNLYSSSNIIRVIKYDEMGGTYNTNWTEKKDI